MQKKEAKFLLHTIRLDIRKMKLHPTQSNLPVRGRDTQCLLDEKCAVFSARFARGVCQKSVLKTENLCDNKSKFSKNIKR